MLWLVFKEVVLVIFNRVIDQATVSWELVMAEADIDRRRCFIPSVAFAFDACRKDGASGKLRPRFSGP